jgi:hypothetical protein
MKAEEEEKSKKHDNLCKNDFMKYFLKNGQIQL